MKTFIFPVADFSTSYVFVNRLTNNYVDKTENYCYLKLDKNRPGYILIKINGLSFPHAETEDIVKLDFVLDFNDAINTQFNLSIAIETKENKEIINFIESRIRGNVTFLT